MKKIINEKNKEIEKLKNEKQAINEQLYIIKEENIKLKEKIEESSLKSTKFIKKNK